MILVINDDNHCSVFKVYIITVYGYSCVYGTINHIDLENFFKKSA